LEQRLGRDSACEDKPCTFDNPLHATGDAPPARRRRRIDRDDEFVEEAARQYALDQVEM
jgi:hypothetical protein